MAPRSRRSKASSSGIEPDLISSLPVNVREKILTYLPIKEAVRTSVLSSVWQETWTSIPELVIQDSDSHDNTNALVKLVDVILLLHSGPIHKFEVQTRAQSPDAFDRWIRNLSRNGIKQLKLNLLRYFSPTFRYKIPSSFFSCKTLASISLRNCYLKLPGGFKGFKFLHTFEIEGVEISGDCIKKLVSCCPVLENLTLRYYGNCNDLNIQAPKLKHLSISGEFTSLNLRAPMLLTLRVYLTDFLIENQSCKTNLKQVLGCMPNLEVLAMESYFVQFLSKGHTRKLPMTFQNLKKLSFLLDIEDEEEAVFVFSLLQNIPNLEVLDIEICRNWDDLPESPIPNFWKSVDAKDFSLKRLRVVNIREFENLQNSISFVELLLGSAPKLEELNIYDDNGRFSDDYMDAQAAMCLKQLLLFRRASVKAQVIIKS
ncbi:hypothetical protein LUZ60_006983 [Juncus effusus]|nr:hypothetical protein LUZ60_006983 [Juncus effusus]